MRRSQIMAVLCGVLVGFVGCSPGAADRSGQGAGTTPPAASPDSAAVAAAVDGFLSSGTVAFKNVQGVVVSVNGHEIVRHEGTPGAASKKVHVWSVTKSVLSTLIGIAIHDKLIKGVEATVAELLPSHRHVMSPAMASTTLKELLTMSAGCPPDDMLWATLNARADATTAILEACRPVPGGGFVYSSTDTHLVAAILAEAISRSSLASTTSVLDYARRKLFDRLQIDTRPAYERIGTTLEESTRIEDSDPGSGFVRADFAWATDPQGIHSGCCLLKLSAIDLSRLGQLYLQNGIWNGQQVVPAEWIIQATMEQTTGYGFLWWTRLADLQPAFVARGSHGQLIMVVPNRRLVLSVTSNQNPDYLLNSNDLEPLVDVITPLIR